MSGFGPERGDTLRGPLRCRDRHATLGHDVEGLLATQQPWTWDWLFEDFLGEEMRYTLHVPLLSANGAAQTVATTGTSRGYITVPRGGFLKSASIVGDTTLATDDTNYVTFSLTNRLGTGSGSTALLAATAANTTQATGGSAWTAKSERTLTNNGTFGNLQVTAGDTLEFAVAATGTLANAVDFPMARLEFVTLPARWYPRKGRTAGLPRSYALGSTANGEAFFQLSSTNEAQYSGMDWQDNLQIPANRGWIFEAMVKFSAITTAQRAVVGMASAFGATLDNVTRNAWFRLEASLAALMETDDNTTDRDDRPAALTLTADTYYLLRIDGTNKSEIKFWINNRFQGKLSAAAFDTGLLQPVCLVQKDSGTGTPSMTVDSVLVLWRRF
jgi:hypothetical protein